MKQYQDNLFKLLTLSTDSVKKKMSYMQFIFWGELIDKYKDINANSKTVFTDYAMLKLVPIVPICFYYSVNQRWAWLNFFSDSENWDLAGTFYHIDAMHAGNQLNRSERFT